MPSWVRGTWPVAMAPEPLGGGRRVHPGQPAAGNFRVAEGLDQRDQAGVNVSGAVIKDPLETAPEFAASTLTRGGEVVGGAAAVAAEILADACARLAHPCPIWADAGQRPGLAATRAVTPATNTPLRTRRAQRPVGPGRPAGPSSAPIGARNGGHVHAGPLVIRARRGRRPDGFFFVVVDVLADPVVAVVSISSAGLQSKMSHNAARMCSDSRSGRPLTSR